MSLTPRNTEFDIKEFERRHRRSTFTTEDIVDAYRRCGTMSPSIEKMIRNISGRACGRVEKKAEDVPAQFVCSVLIDRSPVMSSNWSDVVQGVNKIISHLQEYAGKVHFELQLVDQRRFAVQVFGDTPRKLSVETPLGKGDLALYDYLYEEVEYVSNYVKSQKLKGPMSRIIVMSNTKDTVSEKRSSEMRNLVKRAAEKGIAVMFVYGGESAKMVAEKIGAIFKPIVMPKEEEAATL